MIKARRKEILEQKIHWKEKISSYEEEDFLLKITSLTSKGTLTPSDYGCGAAYFLCNKEGQPEYVIKPIDEDILCLNNRKLFASPYNSLAFRVRDHIPLYRSAQAEALSSSIAKILGYEDLTPDTRIAVLHHEKFFDISEQLDPDIHSEETQNLGNTDKEKLCSVQKYIPNIRTLYSLVEEWLSDNLSEEEIGAQIDQENFEKLFLLIWLLYDTDAHAGNLYAKDLGNGKYHLLKVDNGLTFPDKNHHLLNALYFFPHAKNRPSESLCKVIGSLPESEIEKHFHLFEMEDALEAFQNRVNILKQLTNRECYTLREIDMRLRALELPNGEKVALSECSVQDLEKLISY